MIFIIFSIFSLITGSITCAFFSDKNAAISTTAGLLFGIIACLSGLIGSVSNLICGNQQIFSLPLKIPLCNELSLTVDPLASLFLTALYIVAISSAIYGYGYVTNSSQKHTGLMWAAFYFLIASMVLLFISSNAVLFMTAWEMMATSSFLLVIYEHHKGQTRHAAYIYLLAGAAGALFLLMMFALLSIKSGGHLLFSDFSRPDDFTAALIFICAIIGFGLKAGIVPFHIWLPEAHPAAPSHVSAVMSAIMIKAGIYGIIRVMSFISPWELSWGYTLIILGVVSLLIGALFACAQSNIKRMLAFSSIENIGIITLAFGIGVTAVAAGFPTVAAFAFAGTFIHIFNHALFKSLLFMGAGAIIHSTGTGSLEVLGGIIKKMPITATLFTIGAIAACAFAPLNGIVGELLIYVASFKALLSKGNSVLLAVIAILSLSFAGAIATAFFAKTIGTVFLGEPRVPDFFNKAHESNRFMRIGMIIPAILCLLCGVLSFFFVRPLCNIINSAFFNVDLFPIISGTINYSVRNTLFYVGIASGIFLLCASIAAIWYFLKRKEATTVPTWDCGYEFPYSRMQYGASSFTQPLTDFFQIILRSKHKYSNPNGYLTPVAFFTAESRTLFFNHLYTPIADRLKHLASKFSLIQHGRLQFYILYIITVLFILLIWKL